jgi:hypothetical protein
MENPGKPHGFPRKLIYFSQPNFQRQRLAFTKVPHLDPASMISYLEFGAATPTIMNLRFGVE